MYCAITEHRKSEKSSLGNMESNTTRAKLLHGDNKCLNHQNLICDRLLATAAGTLCHI